MSGFNLSARIEGLDSLVNTFSKSSAIVIPIFSQTITKTAAPIEGSAKGHAPVRYGQLKGSIHTTPITVTSDNVKAAVMTNLDYAIAQEEGTGIYGPNRAPITPKRARVLSWMSNGRRVFARQVRGTPGKHYMRKAWEEGKSIWTANTQEAMRLITAALSK